MREYDRIADWYARTRSLTVGLPELDALAGELPPGAAVLDLGCGTGIPLTQRLAEHGFRVTALDSSDEMVRRVRAALPGVPVRCERAEAAHVAAGSFDAVVAWGVLFHLSAADQGALIDRVASWLRPGGRFLFTSGDAEGERTGTMDGVAFRYVSLGVDGYRRRLERAGLRLVRHGEDAAGNAVYVAQSVA